MPEKPRLKKGFRSSVGQTSRPAAMAFPGRLFQSPAGISCITPVHIPPDYGQSVFRDIRRRTAALWKHGSGGLYFPRCFMALLFLLTAPHRRFFFLHSLLTNRRSWIIILAVVRSWRNWHTRTFEGRVGDRTGSSPVDRTKREPLKTLSFQGFCYVHFAVLPLFLPFTASEMLISGRR